VNNIDRFQELLCVVFNDNLSCLVSHHDGNAFLYILAQVIKLGKNVFFLRIPQPHARLTPFALQEPSRAALAVPFELAGEVRHPSMLIACHF